MLNHRASKVVLGVTGVLGLGVFASCARVSVRKVPSPSQYVAWTDIQQREADEMEGFRFYLPRPFLNVFESFPVRTEVYIAHGVLSSDGKYVRLLEIDEESGLKRIIAGAKDIRVPTRMMRDSRQRAKRDLVVDSQGRNGNADDSRSRGTGNARKEEPRLRVRPDAEVDEKAPLASGGESKAGESKGDAEGGSVVAPKTGINQRAITNDNGAFAYQPLRGNFDLVYVPDFEEQYVVRSKAGLGNAQFELNLGQGWSLQGFNSLTDNSEINKRIFDLIDTSIKLAKQAASAAVGLPSIDASGIVPGGIQAFTQGDTPMTEEDAEKTAVALPYVTLKVVIVHYAAKGLYPIIKPRELLPRTLVSGGAVDQVVEIGEGLPFTGASDLNPEKVKKQSKATDNLDLSFTVPRYPYQYISFNTFKYCAIELVKADSTPFGELYDKTGTKGDSGDARTGEIVDLIKKLVEIYSKGNAPETGGGIVVPPPILDPLEALRAAILDPVTGWLHPNEAGISDKPHLAAASFEPEDKTKGTYNVELKSGHDGKLGKEDTKEALQSSILAWVKSVIEDKKLKIDVDAIVITNFDKITKAE